MSRYIDVDKYRKDLLSAYDDVSMEFEVLDRQPLVQVISLDKVKQARFVKERKSTPKCQKCGREVKFFKDVEEVENESKEDN